MTLSTFSQLTPLKCKRTCVRGKCPDNVLLTCIGVGQELGATITDDTPTEPAVVAPSGDGERLAARRTQVDVAVRGPRHHRLLKGWK